MNWTGGNQNCPLTISVSGALNYNSINAKINSTLINKGILRWLGGNINIQNGAIVNDKEFLIETSSGDILNTGFGSITNTASGIINKLTAAAVTCNTPVTNSGLITGKGGFNFTSSFSNSGTIAPGGPAGILNINSTDNPLTANSVLDIEIFSNGIAGIGFDQLQRSQNLFVNGKLKVREMGAVQPASFEIIKLMSGNLSGNFSSIELPAGYVMQVTPTSVIATKTPVLPVTLMDFKAKKKGTAVDLTWSTSAEYNVAYYELERGLNGVNFVSIGKVNSTIGSSVANNYQFTDGTPLHSNSYYRLKIVDTDGRYKFSSIIKLSSSSSAKQFVIYPNPTAQEFVLSGLTIGKQNQISLYTSAGELLEEHFINTESFYGSLSKYPQGCYLLKINNVTQTVIKR
jgi:hypothetical protein